MTSPGGTYPFRIFHSLLLFLALFSVGALSQARCSKDNLCKSGCCSKDGFCGTTDAYCGDGCQSTCDFKPACDAENPCQDGSCCNQAGFCGFGPDYCASDICIGNCGAKSECDPGFGGQWANATDCPLNACCSDTGYCGITQEFCGDRKFNKPSCDKNYPVNRVVGYYEGGAATRSCNQFSPDDIRADVYTHINFAHAFIDPATFRIIPAFKDDINTYHELASVKRRNPGLETFISVGGWQFGEGPTNEVFSQMVASEKNHRAFITSLVSFLTTYDFDGVDIDWRYPTAPQKGGSSDDMKNFVAFAKNLQAALKTNGLRDGFSLTVPAVYSYLQYFDLKQLSDHVSWFNVLAFDLHGAFRTPDSWINNHLNAHTNLTEIADAVDLIWRSGVPSAKVVMGLAFYSRTFTASSNKCVSKGCPFDSAGEPQGMRCSEEIGLVSNADIDRMLSPYAPKPRLDKKAAVQVFRNQDQWITYEDKTTLQIKVEFSRSQCMGGVMVWAVSQDTKNGTYSHALQSAIGSVNQAQTPARPSNGTKSLGKRDEDDIDFEKIPIDSCRWTNCGGECPSGWDPVRRSEDGKEAQKIWEDSGCTNRQVRTFCCPPGDTPRCVWSDWNKGKYQSSCRGGSIQVGSSNIACNSGSQLACCETVTESGTVIDSMRIWDKCRWEGEEPLCGQANESGEPCYDMEDGRHVRLAKAWWGSGSTQCRRATFYYSPLEQDLCCEPEEEED
ncbi:hypothetical protein CEP54_016268 [Fusarium duplospermum]|uniref:chitinase n=1 Tax=Fusarium duplospermum TaxID=1325734 RepID=A0A428NG69_9HYPO|nr:hypothetical protein CEP54_016268 [Fusarium duplospermum]